MRKKIICSVGVCAYNEERNIGRLLKDLLSQKLKRVKIGEILVIISGSTDNSIKIIKSFTSRSKKIKLIWQRKREGKASAVNLFIKLAKYDVLVLLGGDLQLPVDTIEKLVSPFRQNEVGMTGAHPIPVNRITDGFFSFAAHFLWELHHQISLNDPKMGEVIAFRKIFQRIPILSSVDEANIEPLIRGQGYLIKYRPSAIIYNKAPTNISDFLKQRRRIYCGHLAVKYEQSYEVATLSLISILRAIVKFFFKKHKFEYFFMVPAVIMLEGLARFLGWWDYQIAKKRYTIWEQIKTTKNLV